MLCGHYAKSGAASNSSDGSESWNDGDEKSDREKKWSVFRLWKKTLSIGKRLV